MGEAVPGAGRQQAPPSNGDKDGRLSRRTQVIAALIGALATIAGAVLGIVQPWSHSAGTASAGGVLQVAISSVSHPVINGERVIAVTGMVRNLGAGERVFAFAGQHADEPPWYPSDPATISGGTWKAYIKNLPSSGENYAVWAGAAVPPSPCPSGAECFAGPLEIEKAELALKGPQSPSLQKVTRPHPLVLPPMVGSLSLNAVRSKPYHPEAEISHRFLTDWADSTGLRRTAWTSGGS